MPLIEIYPDRQEWLAARLEGIGASDAYKAAFEPFELWCEKTGRVSSAPPAELEIRFAVGHALEPVIDGLVKKFAFDFGRYASLWDPGDFTIWRARPNGFLTATADRLWMPAPLEDYPKHRVTMGGVKSMYRQCIGPAEFKTVSEYAVGGEPPFADWTEDEPSTHALLQMQHTLTVMGKPRGCLVALVGFSKLWVYEIEAQPALQKALLHAERTFWNHVELDTQPEVSESPGTARALAALFPQDDGGEIELEEEMALPWFERLEDARARKKEAEGEIKLAEIPIKEAMGTASRAIINENLEFVWKTTKSGSRPLILKRKEKR